MPQENQHVKPLYILLCCMSLGALIGAGSCNLERYKVFSKTNNYGLFTEVEIKIILEHDQDKHFNPKEYKLVEHDDKAYLFEKLLLLTTAVISSVATLPLATYIMQREAIANIKLQGQLELEKLAVNHKSALARKSLELEHREEIKALVSLYGDEDAEATEIAATDKFGNFGALVADGHSIDKAIEMTWGKLDTKEHEYIKNQCTQWLERED